MINKKYILIFWQQFLNNKLAFFALNLFICLVVSVIFIPYFIPLEYNEINYALSYRSPSFNNILGTDKFGRDIFLHLLQAGRLSLFIGFVATIISISMSCIVGIISGYFEGKTDFCLMKVIDIFDLLPLSPLVITLIAILGDSISPQQKVYTITILLGLLNWTNLAKILRNKIIPLKKQDFMLATKSLGISSQRQIFVYLLPSVYNCIIISIFPTFATFILIEASLSFLGIGIPQSIATWGNMSHSILDTQSLTTRPLIWIAPIVAIMLTTSALTIIGHGMKNIFNLKS